MRSLLAIRVLNANQVVSTDRLIDERWGEHPPATAAHSLEVYDSKLRRALAPGRRPDDGSDDRRPAQSS